MAIINISNPTSSPSASAPSQLIDKEKIAASRRDQDVQGDQQDKVCITATAHNKSDYLKNSYEQLWGEKLNDPQWLLNDGKGRVEYCASILRATNRISSGLKILDIGCGRGVLANFIDSRENVFGVDISELAIKEAQKVYNRADCINIDCEKLPYPEAFFDLVVLLDVIEHVFDPKALFAEINRVLKGGGEVILSTPNILNENLLKSFIHSRRFPKTSGDAFPYDGGHIHFFTYQDIYDLMSTTGFLFEPIGPQKNNFDYEFKESLVWVLGKKR